MKLKVLASGSKGNSSLLITDNIKVIIDLGMSYPYISSKLLEENIKPSEIDAILITHTHNDHIKGLRQFVKKNNTMVYVPLKMAEELSQTIPTTTLRIIEEELTIKDLDISIIHTSHDAVASVGYIFTNKDKTIVYITDTGYINRKYLERIKNKNIYYIESNHDEEMLMNGPYPHILKQRILSDEGHLSNKTTAGYLKNVVGSNTKYIILAHLSEKNNTEDLAYQTTKEAMDEISYHEEILITKQNESLKVVEV